MPSLPAAAGRVVDAALRRAGLPLRPSDRRSGVFGGTTWGRTPPFTRIFVGRLEAELVSIAGRYLVHEDIAPAHVGQRVQIVLQEQRVVILGSG